MRPERRSFKNVRKSTWAILVTVAFVLGVIWLLHRWLNVNDWAGLGQWFGGLGALVAAWVALRIASDERRRERSQEIERLKVQAFYVTSIVTGGTYEGVKVVIRNASTEPVVNVSIITFHLRTNTQTVLEEWVPNEVIRLVLLPEEKWNCLLNSPRLDLPVLDEVSRLTSLAPQAEIEFEDLNGTVWRRIGDQPPFVHKSA
ncbi:hypothetical protein [Amycolatopsis orientalis]|uniref:hypothetical protein n=1 Tax=Amycolatopsis orientalis TaxID=31958 RepID=UPI0011AB305D|nr:hypothetical protein [Amycolatopsis orientalis]